ncbi:MAG: 3'-5' exonuclease [Eubacterium sp.]|nr:3'-5' exonuclease [Eubacterium sp.]
MTYLAIDLEMTGLNVKRDHILEIGALRMENGSPTGEFSALINPHCAVPETITDLTGITQEMADSGEELSDVLPRFLDFAGDLPLLGHNLSFDYSFLKQAFVNARLPFERTGIDTLKLARRFLPEEQKKKLTELRTLYHIDTGTVHRAVSDAYAAALVYERLLADHGATDGDAFDPKPLHVSIKKQQSVTIPQREQLQRLLSENPDRLSEPIDIDHLTRSEASRLIEKLLHS